MSGQFHKIRRLPPYVFEQVNRRKAELRAGGADIIDLGMGNPDMPAPPHVIAKLAETAAKPNVHGYSASRGIPGLRRALVDYYDRRFGVKARQEPRSHRDPRFEGRVCQSRASHHRAR